MKTHDFANHLEQLAKLLRSLPDTELDAPLISNIQSVLPGIETTQKESNRAPRPLPPGIEKQLIGKSPAEIETFLSSEAEAFTIAHLIELADRIGIPTSKRQGKSALINLITRHFEAEQMHSIIRGARSDDA